MKKLNFACSFVQDFIAHALDIIRCVIHSQCLVAWIFVN